MDNSSCEWIRGRLPLCVGGGDDPHDPGDDGGDLGVDDRRAIERHLAECPGCREHRSELAEAQAALGVAAGVVPVVPDATSLWPALERRIAAQAPHGAGDPGRSRNGEPAAGAGPTWAVLDDERPLRSAWLQDTLREAAEAIGLGPLPDRSGRSPRGSSVSWRVVGASLAASVLLLLIVEPVAWRLRAGAEARMSANAVPVPPLVGPPAPSAFEIADLDGPAPEPDRDLDARQLARAEPIKPPAEPTPAADAAAGGKPATSTRLGYDLQPLTPMPPDGRDAKPVY